MVFRRSGVLAWLYVLLAAAPTTAQNTTLYVMRSEVAGGASCPWPSCDPGPARLIEVDVEGARLRAQTQTPFESSRPHLVASADGRHIAWFGEALGVSRALSVFDRSSRTGARLFGWAPATWPNDFRSIVAHPTEVRAFAAIDNLLFDLSATGMRALDTGGLVRTIDGLSADGHILR